MAIIEAIKRGFRRSIFTITKIAKILIPVYFIVQVLKHSNALTYIANFFAPVMTIFGLPGEAALGLLLSNFINIYAGVAALADLSLSTKQITTLAIMILISHSLLVESAVLKNLDIPRYFVILLRVGVAIIVGVSINLVWGLFA